MNSNNSETSEPYKLLLNLADKINWKRSHKYVGLLNLKMYYTWKNIKKSYKNNKFKTSPLTWYEKFELPDESYYISDLQEHFEYIIKKHQTVTNNPPIRMQVNKIENRISFNII